MKAPAAVAIAWQSMSEAMSPPYTNPGMAMWYGSGVKRATASPSCHTLFT